MSRRTQIVLAIIATQVLLVAVFVWLKTRDLHVQTVSARLTSSGEVIWGDTRIRLDTIQPSLKRSVDSLLEHKCTPRLLIERYRDTRDTDIEKLQNIGVSAGFEIIDIHEHDWNSPSSAPLSN